MKDINEILDRNNGIDSIIDELKEKTTNPPSWIKMREVYEPSLHKIVDDKIGRKDKVHDGGHVDKAARMAIGLEKLLAKRLSQFTFTIPVKRTYSNADSDVRQEIVKAIERIYEEADIDTVNMERGLDYYMACEIFTLWYVVKKQNDSYGFNSEYKLKCRTFSPMRDNVTLYPLMDEYGDMVAMSVAYTKKVIDTNTEFFETWTASKHFKWRNDGKGWVDEIAYTDAEGNVTYGDDIIIMKIPGIYAWKPNPSYEDRTQDLREDAEYGHSRDSDVVAYNSAPVLKIVGKMQGTEEKGETRRIYRVENGGDVSYVAWNQSMEATDHHIQRDIDWFWMLNQMPDISFKNLQSLGNIGFDARQMMLTDTQLRIGEESKNLLQFFRRESNVIKAFLKQMNTKWPESDIDAISIKHTITCYVPKDEKFEIEKRLLANGNKPIESQRESIERWGKSKDVDKTLEEIQEQDKNELMTNLLAGV